MSRGIARSTRKPLGGDRRCRSASSLLVHFIFGTKERPSRYQPRNEARSLCIDGRNRSQLHGVALITNSMADHVHLLVGMPADHSVAEMVRFVKARSSGGIHERWPEKK